MTRREGELPKRAVQSSSGGNGPDWSIRVIIADDRRVYREALVALITQRPFLELVGVAGDAARAIELACRLQPDVALLDVRMPAGGGPEAARGIRECSPATGIVAISAYQDREDLRQMTEAGTREYLLKGKASPEEIVAAIQRASSSAPG